MSTFKIIQADASYLDQLAPLFEKYREFYKQELNASRSRAFLEQRFKNKDSTIYVALLENTVIGFTQLYPLLDSLKLGNLWLLNDLFVDHPYRGKGYSKLLLARAKELAKDSNATGLLLETQKTNKIGNSLYPSVGFKYDNEFNYYFWTNDEFAA